MTSTTTDFGRSVDVPHTTPARAITGSRRRWPAAAGIGMAAFIALGLAVGPAGLTMNGLSAGSDLAPVLAASGLVYLGAAAVKRPTAAWPVFFGTFGVITIAKVTNSAIDATWILFGLAALFAGYGLLRGAAHPADELPLQTVAMAGFGLIAALALIAAGDLGAYLAAAGLLSHAAWDVWHHRTGKVVARSMAEFCFVLDTLVAVAMVIVAVSG